MQQYVNGINVSSLSLGLNSGGNLTTGSKNLLVGFQAGKNLTSGSYNTVLGSYTAADEPTVQNSVILSNGQGTVVARWDGDGTLTQPVNDRANTLDPTVEGVVRLCYDPLTNGVVFRIRKGDTVYETYSAKKSGATATGVDAVSLDGLSKTDFQPDAGSRGPPVRPPVDHQHTPDQRGFG